MSVTFLRKDPSPVTAKDIAACLGQDDCTSLECWIEAATEWVECKACTMLREAEVVWRFSTPVSAPYRPVKRVMYIKQVGGCSSETCGCCDGHLSTLLSSSDCPNVGPVVCGFYEMRYTVAATQSELLQKAVALAAEAMQMGESLDSVEQLLGIKSPGTMEKISKSFGGLAVRQCA